MKTQLAVLLLIIALLGIFSLSYGYFSSAGTLILTKPDIIVSQISFSPSTANTLDSVTIKAIVNNIGNDVAKDFIVEFRDSSTNILIGTYRVKSLPENGFLEIEIPWFPQTFGSHVINVLADSENVVNELSEDNNQFSEVYRIS